MLQELEEPCRFRLIEAYADQAALDAHRASAHYQTFRAGTRDWVVERRWWFWGAVEGNPAA